MKTIPTPIKDCSIINHNQYKDNRGFFQEFYHSGLFKTISFNPIQINHSFNFKYSLRGIHIAPFKKVVSCISGRIIDVCVDFRKNSPTYLQHFKTELSHSGKQLLIPANCGHAFLSLEDNTSVIYMQDSFYIPNDEQCVRYSSPGLGINWGVDESKLIISEKDKTSEVLF